MSLLPLLDSFLAPFLVTIIVEVPIARMFGYRRGWQIACIVLINAITNPALNLIVYLNHEFFNYAFFYEWGYQSLYLSSLHIFLLECVIVVVEWLLLIYAFRPQFKRRIFLLSILMNAPSYLLLPLLHTFDVI